MKPKSILLYLATTDNKFIDSSIKELKSKFSNFDPQIRKQNKIGELLKHRINNDYVAYWCFVKKSLSALISFKTLQKCLQDIAEESINENFDFIYLQTERNSDNVVNEKIVTLLLTCLPKYTIFLG